MLRFILLSLVALSITLSAPTSTLAAQTKWKPGKHYQVLQHPQQTAAAPGKVEVIEVFRYTCPHCASLESHVLQWEKTRPSFIEFVQVPAAWKSERPYAQLYYTLLALGRDDLHSAVFAAIHADRSLAPSQDPEQAFTAFKAFAVAHAIDATRFEQVYRSAAVVKQVEWADGIARTYQVAHVPTLIVNGKYVPQLGEISPDELFELVNELATREMESASKTNAHTAQKSLL